MKLRGGLWVPDSSDAETLAAQVKRLSAAQDSSARLGEELAPQKFVAKKREPATAKSSEESVALSMTARFIRGMGR